MRFLHGRQRPGKHMGKQGRGPHVLQSLPGHKKR